MGALSDGCVKNQKLHIKALITAQQRRLKILMTLASVVTLSCNIQRNVQYSSEEAGRISLDVGHFRNTILYFLVFYACFFLTLP